MERYEIRHEGDQVGDNDNASAIYRITPETNFAHDDVEDKIAVCATEPLAEKLLAALGPGGNFRARLVIEADTPHLVLIETWDDELSPMGERATPTRDWAHEHIAESWFADDVRKQFELPATGDWEILFEGYIHGHKCGPYDEEWDEQIDVVRFKKQELPESYVGTNCPWDLR